MELLREQGVEGVDLGAHRASNSNLSEFKKGESGKAAHAQRSKPPAAGG